MNPVRRFVTCSALGFLGWSCLGAEPVELIIRSLSPDGRATFDEATGEVTDPAGVEVIYGDARLTARRIQVDQRTGDIAADGEVRLQRGLELWTGESLRYNFVTHQISGTEFRTGMPPVFATGRSLEADMANETHHAVGAMITTDDVHSPSYRVQAQRITFVPGQYLEARKATLYVGRIPVFYFPRYRRHLDRHPNNFVFVPGYRTLFGPYLLTTYNWSIATNATAAFHVDSRLDRGVAGGPDLKYDLGRVGKGNLKAYGTRDEDPGRDAAGKPIPTDRGRVAYAHSTILRTNLTARALVNWQSDAYILHDFYEAEYRADTQPKTFLELNQAWSNFTLDALAMPQVNDFYQTVERLPDVKLTGLRQQLGVLPVFYESESSLGYYRFQGGDFAAATNYAALRADTYHQLLWPNTFFGSLNVTPRVGGRFSYYGEEEGEFSTLSEQERAVFNTGVEVSTKASRLWRGTRSSLLDLHGVRHIFEPSVNYAFVPSPSTAPAQLPQFDPELYSLEMLPIDFPDYNSIDSIDSQNVFRFGIRNKIQTKRNEEIQNLVNWATYLDWRIRPRHDQRTYGDLFSDLDLRPRSWVTFNSEVRYDINTTSCRMANHTATLEPNDWWAWKVGHRYLEQLPGQDDESGNNLFLSSLFLRLNENWAVRLQHHFEARNGMMEEQFYTLYRDFRSWTAGLTFRMRDGRNRLDGKDDLTVAISFSLKALPRYKLGDDRDRPDLLLGD